MEAVTSLRELATSVRPLVGADSRLLPVPAPLAGLWPEGGIRRGMTVAVGPLAGGCSLALSLAATVTGGHGWVAAVGMPALGLVAASEAGVDLRRLALVPEPGEQWPSVVAALLDGFELLMLRPPARGRVGDARRLAARARERGTVILLVDAPWPEPADVTLKVEGGAWVGLGQGWGVLAGRGATVAAGGRRVGGRDHRAEVWLPAAGGGVEPLTGGGLEPRAGCGLRPGGGLEPRAGGGLEPGGGVEPRAAGREAVALSRRSRGGAPGGPSARAVPAMTPVVPVAPGEVAG
jgi:hypothetical protein